jgi:hypothetical protein
MCCVMKLEEVTIIMQLCYSEILILTTERTICVDGAGVKSYT